MELIPLKDIQDGDEFFVGTRLRIFNVGLNVADKSDDFYEYMLAEISANKEYMALINIVGHKSGSVLAHVKIKLGQNKIVTTGQALKFSVGTKDTYLIRDK